MKITLNILKYQSINWKPAKQINLSKSNKMNKVDKDVELGTINGETLLQWWRHIKGTGL